MNRACIAIVDGTSARLYAYQQSDAGQPSLVEATALRDDGDVCRFAGDVVSAIETIAVAQQFEHVILVASPNMLVQLRSYEGRLTRHRIHVDEVLRDLTRLTSPQIHDHLAALHVIEPRSRAASARR